MPPTITGIKPTGLPHLGNYLGMIRPALDLARTGDALCFIAGYHALTTLPPPDSVRASALDLAATLIADILIHLAVGSDQRQHAEIARDLAGSFNRVYGPVLVVPEPAVDERVMTIPGIDGRKMSKSYGKSDPALGHPR